MAEGETNDKEAKIPASLVKGFLKDMMESVKKDRDAEREEWQKRDEAREKEVKDLKERMTKLETDPVGRFAEGMDDKARAAIMTKIEDGSLERGLDPVINNLIPQRIMEYLPEAIKKQGKLIAEVTREELEERVPIIVERVVEKEEPRMKQKLAEAVNRFDGLQPTTYDETVKRKDAERKAAEDKKVEAEKRHQRNRTRNKILGAIFGLAAFGALGVAIGTAIYSSKRTAEGAAGISRAAMVYSLDATVEVRNLKTEEKNKWAAHDNAKKTEDEARKAELSGLETKLGEKIDKKSDKTELTAAIADFKKNYTELDAELKKELATNKAREDAYTSYKELADATKKSLDELAKNYEAFSKKAAAKEQTDAEFARIGKNLADAEANIKRYGIAITQLQGESKANSKESAEIRDLYNSLIKNYATMTERMKKIDEELKKPREKPAGNGNYQPLERDR